MRGTDAGLLRVARKRAAATNSAKDHTITTLGTLFVNRTNCIVSQKPQNPIYLFPINGIKAAAAQMPLKPE
jgi:hypothetical protein